MGILYLENSQPPMLEQWLTNTGSFLLSQGYAILDGCGITTQVADGKNFSIVDPKINYSTHRIRDVFVVATIQGNEEKKEVLVDVHGTEYINKLKEGLEEFVKDKDFDIRLRLKEQRPTRHNVWSDCGGT